MNLHVVPLSAQMKVSDDDEDEQNGVDLAHFDTNLIELPPDSPKNGNSPISGIAIERGNRMSQGMQYKSDGRIWRCSVTSGT